MASSLSFQEILNFNKLTDLNYVDWLRNLKSYLLRRSSPIFLTFLNHKRLGMMPPRKRYPHTGCGRVIVWLSSASCWPLWAMSCRGSMRAWILNPYSSILKSCMENRVELLDMRYLSSYSVLEWLRDHPYKIMSWRSLIWSLDWVNLVLWWMEN